MSDGERPRGDGGGRVLWLLPALTFVVGVLLGGVVVAALNSGAGGDDAVAPGPSGAVATGSGASPLPTSSPDVTVRVPAQCAQLAQEARDASDLLGQAATAARDLDAAALADIVRRMQDARDALTRDASACSGVAVSSSTSPSSRPSSTTS